MNNNKLYNYLEENSQEEPNILKELKRETFLKTTHPHMISGHIQGRVLSMISKIINPKNILEIGTFTGYSALCLAEGLQKNGKLLTIDNNPELEYIYSKYFKKSDFNNQIDYILGDAKKIIPSLNQTFDLVFIDADKENYSIYFDLILPKLNSKALILIDNVLWYEKVLDENSTDKITRLMIDFNKKIKNCQEVEVIILPIRDGISLIRKK